jgi:hypothetical protein
MSTVAICLARLPFRRWRQGSERMMTVTTATATNSAPRDGSDDSSSGWRKDGPSYPSCFVSSELEPRGLTTSRTTGLPVRRVSEPAHSLSLPLCLSFSVPFCISLSLPAIEGPLRWLSYPLHTHVSAHISIVTTTTVGSWLDITC